jgi:hypothetical protein
MNKEERLLKELGINLGFILYTNENNVSNVKNMIDYVYEISEKFK